MNQKNMRFPFLLLLLVTVMGLSPFAAMADKPLPPVNSDSCRLYNGYLMNGQMYSESQGTVINGAYSTAKTPDECQKKCLSDEKSRTEDLPSTYTLNVECLYGQRSLYRKQNILPSAGKH